MTPDWPPKYVPVTPPALPSLPTKQLIRLIGNSVKSEVMDNTVGYLRIDRIIDQETAAKLGHLIYGRRIWSMHCFASMSDPLDLLDLLTQLRDKTGSCVVCQHVMPKPGPLLLLHSLTKVLYDAKEEPFLFCLKWFLKEPLTSEEPFSLTKGSLWGKGSFRL